MNNRFLYPVLISLCISSAVHANFLDSLEESLQSAWRSICGIAKTEGENAGELTARSTGVLAGILEFWQKHPKIFKTIVGSAVVVGAVRAQQYLSVKESLDKARVFCPRSVPGSGEPVQKDGWQIYDRRLYGQSSYREKLIHDLCRSSWLNTWLSEIGPNYVPNFNIDNNRHVNYVLAIDDVKNEINRRADAIGTPQYYSWFDTYAVWKKRVCDIWNLRNEVGICTSLATALLFPYDGEATKLMVRLRTLDDSNAYLN